MDNIPRTSEEYRRWWAENTDVPFGYCWCECGEKTDPAPKSQFSRYRIKGQPKKYHSNHAWRHRRPPDYEVHHETGCWVWQRGKYYAPTMGYYGSVKHNGHAIGAHRYYYLLYKGEIPFGSHIHHVCKNTLCVNPDHLQALPARDHSRLNSRIKLTPEIVSKIKRDLRAGGAPYRVLGKKYGVSLQTIGEIKRGRIWPEIT